MCNATLQQFVEVFSGILKLPFAGQDCGLLLLMRLLWPTGSKGCKEIALSTSTKLNLLNSVVEDKSCDHICFLGYKEGYESYKAKGVKEHSKS